MEHNRDIKDLLRKYKISYNDILPYISNFSHTTRIVEELGKPLSDERRKVYLLAIKKVKAQLREFYSD